MTPDKISDLVEQRPLSLTSQEGKNSAAVFLGVAMTGFISKLSPNMLRLKVPSGVIQDTEEKIRVTFLERPGGVIII